MSFEKTLEELSSYSKSTASIQFKRGNNNVVGQLISHKKQCVRDATPREIKLATYCNNETSMEKLRHDLSNRSNNKHEHIDKILKAVESMNEICNVTEVTEKIKQFAQLNDQRHTNLSYLYSNLKRTEEEIDHLSSIQSATKDTDMSDGETDELEEEEQLIQKLEKELKQKRIQSKQLAKKMAEQLKIKKVLDDMKKSNQSSSTIDKDIEELKKEIELEKQRIADIDKKFELAEKAILDQDTTAPLSIRESTISLKARIGELLSNKENEQVKNDESEALITLFQLIQEELQTHLTYLNSLHSAGPGHKLKEQLFFQSLKFVSENTSNSVSDVTLEKLKRIFPNSDIDTTHINISEESHVFAALLLKIAEAKDDGILLSDLTNFINNYTQEHNYPEKLGELSIYKLVGFELIYIDRTKPGSIVFLKELIK